MASTNVCSRFQPVDGQCASVIYNLRSTWVCEHQAGTRRTRLCILTGNLKSSVWKKLVQTTTVELNKKNQCLLISRKMLCEPANWTHFSLQLANQVLRCWRLDPRARPVRRWTTNFHRWPESLVWLIQAQPKMTKEKNNDFLLHCFCE